MGEGGRETHGATLVWRDGESERAFTYRKMSNADKERCKDAAKSAQKFQNSGRPCSSDRRGISSDI
jgi:hypothetical protein